MTNQQTHTDENGNASLVLLGNHRGRLMMRSHVNHPDYRTIVVEIPAARLLAMIDRADPDAMRAYLRETVEHEVPEADSPEDVDEQPDREALLTDAQERRLYLIEQLTKTLPTDETPALAHWIITGGTDVIEDLTLSGEDLNR